MSLSAHPYLESGAPFSPYAKAHFAVIAHSVTDHGGPHDIAAPDQSRSEVEGLAPQEHFTKKTDMCTPQLGKYHLCSSPLGSAFFLNQEGKLLDILITAVNMMRAIAWSPAVSQAWHFMSSPVTGPS